jgi:hypothetical protein
MIFSSVDHRLRFQQLFWFTLVAIFALLTGYFLAVNSLLVALGTIGLLGLMTSPYHSKLSIYLAVATFSSALIVPLFPGRPYMWEFAALLGWSGLVVTISMRQYAASTNRVFAEHRWMLIGVIGYSLVLIVTMFYRGFGLRILGSDQMGGRFYFQQLACAIFPFLFIMLRPNEKTLLRLLIFQCVLTGTFLISDFVLSKAPDALFFLLQFFELPGDAVNFELQANRFGIRRFQSFYVVSNGLFFLLLLKYNLKDFFGRKGVYLIPVLLAVIGVGMLSGHRYLAVIVVGVVTLGAFAERFFTLKNTFISVAIVLFVLVMAYGVSDRLPLAAQRAISFLPGISIHSQAKIDADNTLEIRRLLRKVGTEIAPQYFWMGRGFGLVEDFSWQWDPTTLMSHVNQGRFYNGFIGLMVNTGVFGTFFMLLFLGAGTVLAYRVLRILRRYGCEDDFMRMSKLVAGLWIANAFAFLFLHGDSEFAMKSFSLQGGILVACYEHIKTRLQLAAAGGQ